MAYEMITVRMNRSGTNIPWGFSVAATTDGMLKIASLEKDGLAEKAGLHVNDTIKEINGRRMTPILVNEARNIITQPSAEIKMELRRYIASHPTLPWKLTEKDNKIVVDDITPHINTSYRSFQANEKTDSYSADSKRTYEIPVERRSEQFSSQSKFSEEKFTQNQPSQYKPVTIPISYKQGPFTNVTNVSGKTYGEAKMQQKSELNESYSTKDYTKKTTISDRERSYQEEHPKTGQHRASFTNRLEGPRGTVHTSTSVPISRPIHVDMSLGADQAKPSLSPHYSTLPSRMSTGASPHINRNVQPYHSPRRQRQLSPSASIKHLQYNSPMNLYSPRSAAEQYLQQTGGLFGTEAHLPPDENPVYLNSPARQLIAEEEAGGIQVHSPSTQSASFKRISKACGTPVD